ncbi:hypothetical protein H5410_053178 [Solanum commersonii]|uniref:Uncharacterized protein n=1 Tax=Solanum commersonii TaxID=4109 RepID=A0A9J5X477_SOLCO|nr:hypothetical protein H5410_053178 [Solanum commersonii]
MRGAAHDRKVLEACKAYAVLIPHLLDCGGFVSAFAEYFIRSRQFPIKFDVDQYRSRLACLLWNYGLNKQKEDAESESEFPKKKSKLRIKHFVFLAT